MPLAKWAMLLAGNYRCITPDGMRTAQEAVHSNLEESRSVYNFVNDLCVQLGASPNDLVPFEKYAAAAQSLTRPASAARALQNGAPNIERADKLVQLIARQKGLSHPVIDADGGAGRHATRCQPQEGGGLSRRRSLSCWRLPACRRAPDFYYLAKALSRVSGVIHRTVGPDRPN